MNAVLLVARFGARDLIRSRWIAIYALFFAATTAGLMRFSDTEQKALLSLVNLVLFVVPLASVVFGAMYLYAAREFVELMLAQPLPRRRLFAGLYLGLALPLAGAAAAGIAIPLVALIHSRESIAPAISLVLVTALLALTFTGLSAAIVYRVDDRVRGLAAALATWLILAVLYDGLALMLATQFADYPIERPMLAAMIANPVDLARLLLLFQFDVAALLGYTGAVFQRFFAGAFGIAVAGVALVAWTVTPAALGGRLFTRKDF